MSDVVRAAVAVQQANHFSLSGQHVHVDYSSTSIIGQPRLSYTITLETLPLPGQIFDKSMYRTLALL
jgi:hypothetical protein